MATTVYEQDARWCAMLQHLVLEGGAITVELETRMVAAGLDLDRLHRCLQAARVRAAAAPGGPRRETD